MATFSPSSQSRPSADPSRSLVSEQTQYSSSQILFQNNNIDSGPALLIEQNHQRSSSPTPSEKEELKEFDGLLKKMFRKKSWRDKNFRISIGALAVVIVLAVLLAVYHKDIVDALAPVSEWIRDQPAGFLIPIALLIVFSIPPLAGAEIIHIMCGMIYGTWMGFLVVAVGTILGESLTYFLFRYWLRSRAEKMEKGSPQWGALARVIRNGGFWVHLIIRCTAVPTHISTGLYAVCGVSFTRFLITLVLSLPRQLAGVVIGDLAAESASGETSKKDKIVSNTVLGVTIITTIIAMHWINKRMDVAALAIIRERRAQADIQLAGKLSVISSDMLHDPVALAKLGAGPGLREACGMTVANERTTEQLSGTVPPNTPPGAMLPTARGAV